MNTFFVAFFLCMAAMVSAGVTLTGEDDGQWRGEGLLESQDWAGRTAWASPVVSTWGAPGLVSPGVWGSGLVRSGVVAPGILTPGVVANNWANTWAVNGGW